MQARIKTTLVLATTLGVASWAQAFSLLGPLNATTWQVTDIGFSLNPLQTGAIQPLAPWDFTDIGGPVFIGEEYRWNSPVITYAFDQSFLNYFGTDGVKAVESAIAVLNAVPPVSKLSTELTEYPTDNKRVNFTAQALGVADLKSLTLSILLEVMGLADPERWVWCLRDRYLTTIGQQTFTNYIVIQRNFDPVTCTPTNRVNAMFYGYEVQEPLKPGDFADAVEIPLDPDGLVAYSSVASAWIGSGEIYAGLTRDDVGGWRYLLRAQNYNVEDLPSDAVAAPAASLSSVAGSPWRIFVGGSNTVVLTNFSVGPPWSIYQQATNGAAGTTNNLIVTALRPGVEKISFIRTSYDSLLGQAFIPVTNIYTDTVLTNYIKVAQRVERVMTQPDILFGVQDVYPNAWTRSVVFNNNDANNGQTAMAGPGTLAAPIRITYTDTLPNWYNFTTDDSSDVFGPSVQSIVWGSFDASPDTPIIIYPYWLSIQQLEGMVLHQ